jgi:hypothetical protein
LNPINFFSGNIIDGGFLENSPDWLYGSHVFQVRASGLRADTSVNWTGKYENLLNDFVVPGDTLTSFMSTATSASRLAITTDLLQAIPDQRLGVAAWCIAAYQNSANTSATAQLGSQATVAGVVETEALSTVTLINSGAGFVSTILMQGLPAGLTQPTPLDQLDLILNPGTIGGTIKMALLSVQVECLGYWGREDLPASVDTPRPNPQVHNSPYPKSQASLAVAPPPAPFVVYSGQYTGTGAGQEISFVQPVHWIFIRKVAASAPTRLWWSTRVSPMAIDSANGSLLEGVNVSGLSPTTMKLSGTDTVLNGNGLTYQYVAVSDTAMRFMCNAEMAGFSQSAGTAQNLCLLADPLFSIGAAFGGREAPDTGVNQQWYADSAMAALVASTITGNTTTNKFTCGVGSLNVDSSVQRTGVGSQFSCWRDTDQNGDSGSVDILTYTGDGTGARNIAVALGGRSPLLAFIFPETSGGCVYRDPGFTGTNSAGIAGTIITTGITGGDLNQITVASNLNTNAVVYHVFVIAGAINPGGWSGQVVDVATAPTEQAAPGPFIPDVVRGWYYSDEAFAGNVQVTTFNGRPRPPRDWDKLSAFSAKFGGSPGASVTFHNHIIYPGNDYVVSTDQPPIRLFDGVTDRLVGNIPNSGATISQAIVSMLLNAGIVYLTSFDSGTTSANFAGRVFTFNPLTTELAQLSTGFSAGEVPYAMVWHMGRLWVGTNKGDGSAGTIYYIRPGLDTAWTTDHVLAAGGAVSMVSYQGELYVGTDNTVGNFAHVYKRDSSGTWTTSLTATGGAAAVNNRFPSMLVDNGFIYASYFNADATNIAKIYQFNGTAWSTVYNGASGTLRPFILLFKAVKQVFAYGGSTTQAAALITTSDDGVTWLDLTAELVGAQRAPIPTVGLVQ